MGDGMKRIMAAVKKSQRKIHPDYGLADQARGRCPYCLASADMDCDCEKKREEEK